MVLPICWSVCHRFIHLRQILDMNYTGFLVGALAFLCIGVCHPLVIKTEYYLGRRFWKAFFAAGLALSVWSLLCDSDLVSVIVGNIGFCFFWSAVEVVKQHKRVLLGRAKRNPNRVYESLALLAVPAACSLNYSGLIAGFATFLMMAIGHLACIWGEYWFTKRCWPAFLVVGLSGIAVSLFVDNLVLSVIAGVSGFIFLWGIGEVIEQEKRVAKGWFPKRKTEE